MPKLPVAPPALLTAFLLTLCTATAPLSAAPPKVDPKSPPVPNWIWADKQADNQTVGLRGAFELPAGDAKQVESAALWGACDDEMTVFINGKQAAHNTSWALPVTVDVKKFLEGGRNTIAVLGKNGGSAAGLIAKLRVTLAGGKTVDLVTDASWVVATELPDGWQAKAFDASKWTKATVVGKFGDGPWGEIPKAEALAAAGGGTGVATPADQITTLPGFKIERLYSVPKETQNSWVSMTSDPKGRLIVSGENGPMFRVTVGKTEDDTKVEPIDVPLGHAQGLLWVKDALYVTVNGGGIEGNGSGLYRVTDTNGDDALDKVELLFKINGNGEHGPHATRLGPDGKLYLVAGNFTEVPEGTRENSPHRNWGEDILLPRNPDGGGHDPHVMAPAGWIVRMDLDGKNKELFCAGLRNTYDIDFNTDGELFTYDSDMEWDTGTPWYRPIRVNLAVSGGEYGWRNGTGKWPEYYPDSLGAVVNTGMGSPTGVAFGTGAKFPERYQRAFFVLDWSYGNVYAVHMTPEGAGYRGTFEKFVNGKPFGVTDVVISPADGNMYVTIGGRGSQSGLYRVSYTGNDSTAPVKAIEDAAAAEARATRHKIEQFHTKRDAAAVDFVWPYLDSPDRYLRYAARVALERQDVKQWKQRALDERSPTASVNALIALIRAGSVSAGLRPDKTVAFRPVPALQQEVLDSLKRLEVSSLSEEQTLEALRALGLCFIRLGAPDEGTASGVAQALDPLYPSQSRFINRELSQLLAYVQAPTVVAKSMKLLQSADTQEDQLHYVLVLRHVKSGWTPELRQAYFSWMNLAQQKYVGGHSFKNFVNRIREDAVATLTPAERTKFEPFLKGAQSVEVVQETAPRQFVRNWQMSDLTPVIEKATTGRSFEKGKQAFAAAQCLKCHRFGGEGAATGPDLTGTGNRFAPTDVLEAILLPSKVISDQYRPTEFITKNKTLVSGQVEADDGTTLTIRANPLAPETVKLKKADVVRQRPARLSLMPEGLVDTLNEEEILDLIAYLRSGGNKDDKAFK
jgi:putative heme-binding domain-containing protein